MLLDALLAVGAALLAIVGTFSESKSEPRKITILDRIKKLSKVQRAIVIIAILVAIFAIAKAYYDDKDKEFMKVALAANLKPTASFKNQLFDDASRVVQNLGYKDDVDYNYVSDGMVFFLKNSQDEDEEIVFDNSELGQMYVNQLYDRKNDEIIEQALRKKADFSEYNEDTYNRVYILLLNSVEKVARRDPIHSYYDEKGFTAYIEEGKVEIPAGTLKSVNKPSFSSALSELDEIFRKKVDQVIKARPTPAESSPNPGPPTTLTPSPLESPVLPPSVSPTPSPPR